MYTDRFPETISSIKKGINKFLDKELECIGINCALGMYIIELNSNGPENKTQMSKHLGVDKANTTRMIAELEQMKIVQCVDDKNFSLTDYGKVLSGKIENQRVKMLDVFCNGISKRELENFKTTLDKIFNNIEKAFRVEE